MSGSETSDCTESHSFEPSIKNQFPSSDDTLEESENENNPCGILIPCKKDEFPSDPEGWWDLSPRSRGEVVSPPWELLQDPPIFSDYWEESDEEKQGDEPSKNLNRY